jgi:PcfJ-like protein
VLICLDKNSLLVSDEIHIQAVINIVKNKLFWKNDIFRWRPVSKLANVQLNELINYLFCKYKVPKFLYSSFYESKEMVHMEWLIHLGQGGSIKKLNKVPIPFTQKMGHYFTLAPDKLNTYEAIRWGQTKGLGGSDDLAERVANSWLGNKPYSDEDFWESFLILVINGGMFNMTKLTELVDYVREAKRENVHFQLKGRTLQSLFKQSDIWHKHFAIYKVETFWKPCGIEGLKIEKKNEILKLEELTGSKELAIEGKTMKHCVSSYSFYCSKGRSAIFSVRKYAGGILLDVLATIEVNVPLKRVVQAKAKMNKPISEEVIKLIEIWRAKEGLEIGGYL